MQPVFGPSPLAFPTFESFNGMLNQVQQIQSFGYGIDNAFRVKEKSNPSLNQNTTLLKFFRKEKLKYLKAPVRQQAARQKFTNSAIGAFMSKNAQQTSGSLAATIAEKEDMFGQRMGQRAIQYVKAAISVATRASETQLQNTNTVPVHRGGLLNKVFPKSATHQVDPLLHQFGRFMDPRTVREMLWNYGLSHDETGFRNGDMYQLQQEATRPGSNLAEEAAYVTDTLASKQMHRAEINKKIRFQRLTAAPRYLKKTPMQTMYRVVREHEAFKNTDFRPIPARRFVRE